MYIDLLFERRLLIQKEHNYKVLTGLINVYIYKGTLILFEFQFVKLQRRTLNFNLRSIHLYSKKLMITVQLF